MTLTSDEPTFGETGGDLRSLQVDPFALATVPRDFAYEHRVLPLARTAQHLRIACTDVCDDEAIDALRCVTGLTLHRTRFPSTEVEAAIEKWYERKDPSEDVNPEELDPSEATREPLESSNIDATDAPVIALVQGILQEAIRRGASDIHLEPTEKRLRVRYRIDGSLQEVDGPPKALQLAIVSRIKIMADISIAEKRVPQDGRIQTRSADGALDLRVSTVPGIHGEGVVMRLLHAGNLQPDLTKLGFLSDDRSTFERMVNAADGIVLVTGPTGSGKTTTLYSCLHYLNRPERKIITVEDPVEYQLSGINQVPVRTDIGMTFAAALRAMLRQAPNVVMVGEVRDAETAEIALQAALTGHLVFSTLHTNDAVGAVTRLIDLGVKPFLVASALRGVLSQRLVRRICHACSEPHRPELAEWRAIGGSADDFDRANFRRGAGCANCHGSGYAGRLVICELLEITEELRGLIHGGASASRLRSAARLVGLRTLRSDGLRKVTGGLTTVEEVVSITVGDFQ